MSNRVGFFSKYKMNCLIDWIGLDSCTNTVTPESGEYINSLPGIELRQIQAIADDDQQTFLSVWADVQARAAKRFKSDLIYMFSKRYTIRQIKELINMGKQIDPTVIELAANNYVGHTIELNQNTDDQIVNSNYSAIFIQEVKFYAIVAPATDNVTLKIFDLDLGVELYTTTLSTSVTAGWQRVAINQNFNVRRIFVCVDSANIDTVELSISGKNYFQNWCCGMALVNGATAPNTTEPETYTEGDNTFGVSTIFSVVCQYDNLVCNNKEHFGTAWKYCLGIELMTERIFTSRLNRWTTTDLNRAKELNKYFNLMYVGGADEATGNVSEGFLTQAVDTIELDCHDACFECNNQILFNTSRM